MRTTALLVALALLPGLASAQDPKPPSPEPAAPTIKLPEKLTVKAGEFAELKAETTGKQVKWVALTPGLSVRPCDNGKTLVVTGLPGSYDLLAYTAVGDVPSEPARVTVVIGDPPAPPPLPVPPAPPPPADPLKLKLAAAYASSGGTDSQKKDWAKDLAALYRAAAKLAGDPSVTTAGALKNKLAAAAGVLVGADPLTDVRKAVSVELAAILPTDAELTTDQRTATAALFTRLASLLEEIAR